MRHLKDGDLLRPSIEKLSCLFEVADKIDEAKHTCFQVIELINSLEINSDLKKSYRNIDEELTNMILKSALKLEDPDAVLPLSQALTKTIQFFYYKNNSGTALAKLLLLGSSLLSWTPKDKLIVEEKMKFINELLEEMQNLDGSSIKVKSLVLASFLCDIGKCYRNMNDNALALTNFQLAINLI